MLVHGLMFVITVSFISIFWTKVLATNIIQSYQYHLSWSWLMDHHPLPNLTISNPPWLTRVFLNMGKGLVNPPTPKLRVLPPPSSPQKCLNFYLQPLWLLVIYKETLIKGDKQSILVVLMKTSHASLNPTTLANLSQPHIPSSSSKEFQIKKIFSGWLLQIWILH